MCERESGAERSDLCRMVMNGSGHQLLEVQTPPGNNERIYRPWHFSCPWTCYLQIRRSIAGWNTTWREDLMIPTHTHTHTGHIFLAPLSYVNTWGKHKLRHAPRFNVLQKNKLCFFVFCCLQASNHVNDTVHPVQAVSQSITDTKRKATESVSVHVWRRWKRCEIQPLNCHLSGETTKGVDAIILPVTLQVSAGERKHAHIIYT